MMQQSHSHVTLRIYHRQSMEHALERWLSGEDWSGPPSLSSPLPFQHPWQERVSLEGHSFQGSMQRKVAGDDDAAPSTHEMRYELLTCHNAGGQSFEKAVM